VVWDHVVAGSNPVAPTIKKKNRVFIRFLFLILAGGTGMKTTSKAKRSELRGVCASAQNLFLRPNPVALIFKKRARRQGPARGDVIFIIINGLFYVFLFPVH
jgi:hypothetical protein